MIQKFYVLKSWLLATVLINISEILPIAETFGLLVKIGCEIAVSIATAVYFIRKLKKQSNEQ